MRYSTLIGLLVVVGYLLVPSSGLAATIYVTPSPVTSQATLMTHVTTSIAGWYHFAFFFNPSNNSYGSMLNDASGLTDGAHLFSDYIFASGVTLLNGTNTAIVYQSPTNNFSGAANAACGAGKTKADCEGVSTDETVFTIALASAASSSPFVIDPPPQIFNHLAYDIVYGLFFLIVFGLFYIIIRRM